MALTEKQQYALSQASTKDKRAALLKTFEAQRANPKAAPRAKQQPQAKAKAKPQPQPRQAPSNKMIMPRMPRAVNAGVVGDTQVGGMTLRALVEGILDKGLIVAPDITPLATRIETMSSQIRMAPTTAADAVIWFAPRRGGDRFLGHASWMPEVGTLRGCRFPFTALQSIANIGSPGDANMYPVTVRGSVALTTDATNGTATKNGTFGPLLTVLGITASDNTISASTDGYISTPWNLPVYQMVADTYTPTVVSGVMYPSVTSLIERVYAASSPNPFAANYSNSFGNRRSRVNCAVLRIRSEGSWTGTVHARCVYPWQLASMTALQVGGLWDDTKYVRQFDNEQLRAGVCLRSPCLASSTVRQLNTGFDAEEATPAPVITPGYVPAATNQAEFGIWMLRIRRIGNIGGATTLVSDGGALTVHSAVLMEVPLDDAYDHLQNTPAFKHSLDLALAPNNTARFQSDVGPYQ